MPPDQPNPSEDDARGDRSLNEVERLRLLQRMREQRAIADAAARVEREPPVYEAVRRQRVTFDEINRFDHSLFARVEGVSERYMLPGETGEQSLTVEARTPGVFPDAVYLSVRTPPRPSGAIGTYLVLPLNSGPNAVVSRFEDGGVGDGVDRIMILHGEQAALLEIANAPSEDWRFLTRVDVDMRRDQWARVTRPPQTFAREIEGQWESFPGVLPGEHRQMQSDRVQSQRRDHARQLERERQLAERMLEPGSIVRVPSVQRDVSAMFEGWPDYRRRSDGPTTLTDAIDHALGVDPHNPRLPFARRQASEHRTLLLVRARLPLTKEFREMIEETSMAIFHALLAEPTGPKPTDKPPFRRIRID